MKGHKESEMQAMDEVCSFQILASEHVIRAGVCLAEVY